MNNQQIRKIYDGIGPEPNMSFEAFRKEFVAATNQKDMKRDLETVSFERERRRTLENANKRRIDRKLNDARN